MGLRQKPNKTTKQTRTKLTINSIILNLHLNNGNSWYKKSEGGKGKGVCTRIEILGQYFQELFLIAY